jgi:nicotinate dehydrogenase subunit B
LTSLSHAPLPWTEAELFSYLRHGHAAEHGSAGGPMAPVVQQLAALPDDDLRAMATYLASFNRPAAEPLAAAALVAQSTRRSAVLDDATQRLYTTACGACHHDGDGPQLPGRNLPLALNSNLHSARPDNLLRVILEGIREPASTELGHMPAYRDAFDDTQLARLAAYLRARYAADKPPWADLAAASARVRAAPSVNAGI